MPLPLKPWFRVAEIAERWGLTAGDIEDYALDEQLELSVLMVGVAVEEGVPLPSGDGGKPAMSEGQIMLNGPQRLLRVSLLEIVRNGQAEIHRFGPAQPGGYVRLPREAPPKLVRREDLLMTRAERDRFEQEHGLGPKVLPAIPLPAVLQHESDFRVLHFRGETWNLGPMQASVVRQLHEAWSAGQHWMSGKQLLTKAGANTLRMRDLFKTHPGWQTLLLSDGRGHYRINLPIERIRLFRRAWPQSFSTGAIQADKARARVLLRDGRAG